MAQTKQGVFENKWIETALIYSGTVLCICSLRVSPATNTIRESSGSHLVCKRRGESDLAEQRLGPVSNRLLQCLDTDFGASFLTVPIVVPLGKVGECLSWSPREESLYDLSSSTGMRSTTVCSLDKPH